MSAFRKELTVKAQLTRVLVFVVTLKLPLSMSPMYRYPLRIDSSNINSDNRRFAVHVSEHWFLAYR